MKSLIEVHILQNFAPSNLNRDDTGSPKDALFGGYRRARISSQCLKRAVRAYLADHPEAVPAEALAVRTKLVVDTLVDALAARGRARAEAEPRVVAALGGAGLKVARESEDDPYLTEYLLFLGQREIGRLADLIDRHWENLAAPEPEAAEGRRGARAGKRAAREAVPAEVGRELKQALDGGRAVDLALFGRMLADLPEKNQDAACQVAHALSTHAVEREFDFYTAVDDIKQRDEEADAGAGMMGTIEFTSACFYRYVALDLQKLRANLQGDTDLALRGVEALLRGLARAKPTGKQNSFAAHNDPDYIAVTVRRDADPRNLANAFESPVTRREWARTDPDGTPIGLTGASVERLHRTWRKLETAYGQAGATLVLNLTEATGETGETATSLDDLVAGAMTAARAALEG
jgi:CRISPR system Cascade subunit CasC